MRKRLAGMVFLSPILAQGWLGAPALHENVGIGNASPDTSIIVVSNFHPMKLDVRKSKRLLYAELTDSLKTMLKEELTWKGWEVTVAADHSDASGFLRETEAIVLVVDTLDVRFEESGESESQDSEGRTRYITKYDLCTEVKYRLLGPEGAASDTTILDCHYFTSRSTTASFRIQFGPDVVGKKEHSFEAVRKNVRRFVSEFFGRR